MFFRDIIGQQQTKDRLIRSVKEERISHAQLFSGPEGNGKFALALAYAQYISCRNRTGTDNCGTCPSCHKYQKLAHPDLHFVFPVFRPKNTPSDRKIYCDDFLKQWRAFLIGSTYFNINQWMNSINAENAQATIYSHESESIIKKLNVKPFEAEFKVMIVWLPERMNIQCANKLLKMIEEPPNKTLFLLVTEDETGIISTIRSRTQIIRIPRIDANDLQEALLTNPAIEPEIIAQMVHRSNGNYLRALEYLNPGEDKQLYLNSFQNLMRFAYQSKVIELLDLAEELADIGRERQKEFFLYSLQLVREFFMLNFGKPSLVYLTRTENDWGIKFSPFINERNVIPISKVFEDAYYHISGNGNSKIVITDAALKIVRLIKN